MKNWDKVQIHGWMFSKLHLAGNDLIVFALIFSGMKNEVEDRPLSQSKWYAEIMGVAETTVRDCIKRLKDRGLIIAEQKFSLDGNHYNNYFPTLEAVEAYHEATVERMNEYGINLEEEK